MLVPARVFRSATAIALLVGTLVSTACLLLSWRYGFDPADEGYYWYGAQRMLAGELPLRDFMAYDIGRYAWAAAVMFLLGDNGIVGARAAAGLFQVATVVPGVVLVLRACGDKLTTPGKAAFAACVALALNLWVYPYYKVFDYGTSILIVAMLVMMLESVSVRRWFAAGVVLGLAAVMGRNHGVYGVLAIVMLCAFLGVKQRSVALLLRPGLALIAGTVLGFSPTFVLCLLADGFGAAFFATIIDMLDSGTTNIALPVPWPWIHHPHLAWTPYQVIYLLRGLGFVAIIVLPLLALIPLMRRPLAHMTPARRLMLCSAFAALAYAHYAYSRADLTHLALAIAPVLLLALTAGAACRKATHAAIAVLLKSTLTLSLEKPILGQWVFLETLSTIRVDGTDLYLYASQANGIARRLAQVEKHLAPRPGARENFLIVPDSPTIYAIYRTRMPIWEIYALSARSPAFEAKELARLQAAPPQVVFVSDHALDGRPELRYSRLHPLLYRWIETNYRRIPDPAGSLQVFVK